uniref:MOB kinase activator 2 n=1 Tax=Oryctolagus cuniculus TaxID=9986 RepID=A0A5F9C4F6_RABIT
MLGDHCAAPADRVLLGQPPKTGLHCKMVFRAVSKVLRKSKAKPNGKKPGAEEKKVYLEPEHARSRIADFAFKELVVLPREIDLHEWLASNTTTFFHHINLQYSTISEFCTGETCQTMAVCNTQYYWYDERGKKVKCTAPQYVDFVMSSVQKLVTDEDVFPTKYGTWPCRAGVARGRGSLLHALASALCPGSQARVGTPGPHFSKAPAGRCRPAAKLGEHGGMGLPGGPDAAAPPGREFPSSFESLVKKICRFLFHVLGHIYWAHFKETLALELHGHLNTLYVHFILFAREFNLLDPKETAVMDDLTEVLCGGPGGAGGGGPGAQNHVKER